ncbi:polysaccharide deacetylase family sporulation protein PdaB [Paenibacillus shirakamiensis]|uniref:Polysaccharide deacetylase family sporulation protein PdaB n=1 Tax=Paenibacillus shirakamiensis TaxID=1265935 RepID=A0ABS4JNH1_9BACL|nr:polysaccharide deacetylase family sporulation protein PdaB [Paenibacillus shirakamiensis]MBP2002675.1 polysaccharide deacetylase family sporulation protein PdaB [Paenibacillus shirakamiensis]
MNNFFYVLNGKKIKRFFFVFAAAMFAAGIIYVESDHISVFSEGNPSAVYSVATDKKVIALTFDISWGDKRTEPILQVLKDKGVKNATFFLSSPWSKTHPDVVKDIQTQGFEIGSHGHKHVNYSTLTEEEIKEQLKSAHSILTDLTGKEPNLLRLPNGDFDKKVLKVADSLGYKVIQWDTDSQDWLNKGVDNIVNRVVSKSHPGDIVLLHASDSSKQTHEALPIIIDELRKKGYEFVTVSELLNQSAVKGSEVRDQAWIQKQFENAAGL